MNMDMYWPEYRVYLFGLATFLTETIENKAISAKELRHLFPHGTTAELNSSLRDYKVAGYFNVKLINISGKPKHYMLTNVNKRMFQDEFAHYLSKFELNADKLELLWMAVGSQVEQYGFEPSVRWKDVYDSEDTKNSVLPFWEMIFKLAHRGWIKLESAEYTRVAPVLAEDGIVEKMPKIGMNLLRKLLKDLRMRMKSSLPEAFRIKRVYYWQLVRTLCFLRENSILHLTIG